MECYKSITIFGKYTADYIYEVIHYYNKHLSIDVFIDLFILVLFMVLSGQTIRIYLTNNIDYSISPST